MAMNVKYIRWAAKGLKVVMVINVLMSVAAYFLTLSMTTSVTFESSPRLAAISAFTNINFIVEIIVSAFIMYTAARGLELFADVAERVEVIRRTQ